MTDEDAILNAKVVYSEEEVLDEFWECCELGGRGAMALHRADVSSR